MAAVKIAGLAPDLDETTPGIFVDAENVAPSKRGYEGAPAPTNTDMGTATGTVVGAGSVRLLDGTTRTFMGTAGELFEDSATSWASVTRSAGDYTAGTFWRFAQLGNATFATNGNSVIQRSISSGAFSDLTGAPICQIVEVVNNQVFALATNDATFGDQPDRWITSALGNPGDWTLSIATQASSAQIVDTPGPITGGKKLGDEIAIYKETSLYLGRYVGPPTIWDIQLVSSEIGAVSDDAISRVRNVHYFMGTDNFYVYDGSRPQPIGDQIREFFFNEELNTDNRSNVESMVDLDRNRVYWFYPSLSGTRGMNGLLDRFVVYDYRRGLWGIGPRNKHASDLAIETVFEFTRSTGLTYDNLGSAYATYDDIPAISYNSPLWVSQVTRPSIFNTNHKLQTLDGDTTTASMRLWTIGDDQRFSFFSRLRPRFRTPPTSAIMVGNYKENLGDTETSEKTTAVLTNGKFDFERSSRWHSQRVNCSGNFELTGFDFVIQGEGDE